MKNIYVISDTHFGHWFANWFWKRPFKNLKDMNKGLIDNWNETVDEDDLVIIVGDFFAGNKKFLAYLLKELKGEKILVKGNHDTKRRYNKILKDGRVKIYDRLEFNYRGKEIIFTHIAQTKLDKSSLNIHGHYHRVLQPASLDRSQYFNACVEHNNYRPILLDQVLEMKLKEEVSKSTIEKIREDIRNSKRNREFAII